MITKTVKCKNPTCDLSFLVSAEIKPCSESVHNFKAFYTVVGAKEFHGTGLIICHCKQNNSIKRFAAAFERNAIKETEKELRRLQRDLNSHRLLTYIEGDQSEQEQARQRERAEKLARFNEVLVILRGVS
jgi:hypothetical protein